jgi:hypothetical protein
MNSVLLIASSVGGLLVLPSFWYVLSLPYVIVALIFVAIGMPAMVIATLVA